MVFEELPGLPRLKRILVAGLKKHYSKEDLDKFVESLDSKTFVKIQKFYETMPKLTHEIEVTNPKTNVKSNVVLQGLTDFFG